MEIKARKRINTKNEEFIEFDCDYENKDKVRSVGAKWNNISNWNIRWIYERNRKTSHRLKWPSFNRWYFQ